MRGKTTVLDAVALAIGGHIPRHGKSNAKLASVIGANSESASLRATFSDGRAIRWSLKKTASGSLTKKAEKSEFSQHLIDPELFFTAKQNERIVAIQSALGIRIDIIKELSRLVPSRWQSKKAEAGEWIEETTAFLKEEIKALNDNIKRQDVTIQGLVQHEGEEPPDRSQELASARAQLEDLIRKAAVAEQFIKSLEDGISSRADVPYGLSRPMTDPFSDRDMAIARDALSSAIQLARDADNSRAELEMFNDASLEECPHCGAGKSHWSTGFLTGLEKKADDLRLFIANAPTEDDINLLKSKVDEIERVNQEWEAYNEEARSINDACKKRAEAERSLMKEKASLAAIELDRSIIDKKIADLELSESKSADARAAKKLRERCIAERDDSQKEKDRCAESLASLTSEVAALSQRIMSPVIEKASRFTDGILPGPLVASGFDIGYTSSSGDFVPLDGFSGTERIAASAGVQAALMLPSDPRIIMVDEFQRVVGDKRSRLLSNMANAIQDGLIDQVIVAGANIEFTAMNSNAKVHIATIQL